MGRLQQHQRENLDHWAVASNGHCGRNETGVVEWEPVYRQTSRQLNGFCEQFIQRTNAIITMLPIRQSPQKLRKKLRKNFCNKWLHGSCLILQWGKQSLLLLHRTVPTKVLVEVRAGGSAGDALYVFAGSYTVEVGIGDKEERGAADCAAVGVTSIGCAVASSRRPQTCIVCGHRKHEGGFKAKRTHPRTAGGHGNSLCQVPVEETRDQDFRRGRGRSKTELRILPPCQCKECSP